MKNKYHIICITPIDHLSETKEILNKNHSFFYKPNIKKKDLKKFLINNKNINAIFCNPNKQGFILDSWLLSNTGIKYINTASTGTDHIDLSACKKLKINVYSLKNDKKLINKLPSTSELSFCLMIALLKNLITSHNSIKYKHQWNYENYIGQELSSLTVGIIGFGRLGKFMAKFCSAFGMNVLIYDKYIKSKKFQNSSLNYLASKSDVISLHVHLKNDTLHLINKKFLEKCKKKPIIVNTSRGNIVDEKSIIESLKNKKIIGYGADVISDELKNYKKSIIIKNLKNLNIILTPHLGGMTFQGQNRAFKWAALKFK